jgi:serine/threonine-protein kinase
MAHVLEGRFQLEGMLSQSKTGRLFRAVDLETGLPAAVKIISPLAKGGNENLSRRLQEYRLLKNLGHPNSVRPLHSGLTPDNCFYMAMELVEGQTLADLIHEKGALSPQETADYLDQLASVLDAAHAVGIVHRNIKPRNLMVQTQDDGRRMLKLLGFGSAKVPASVKDGSLPPEPPGLIVGSPPFVSPEQALGRLVSKLSDVYSVGVTLFASLTGRLPYDVGTDAQILAAHAKAPIPRFFEKNPQCAASWNVESVVRQAMAKEPADRPASVGALARLFREAAESNVASAPPMIADSALLAAAGPAAPRQAPAAMRWPIVLVVVSLAGGVVVGALMAH